MTSNCSKLKTKTYTIILDMYNSRHFREIKAVVYIVEDLVIIQSIHVQNIFSGDGTYS